MVLLDGSEFPLQLHDVGTDFRLNDDPDIKLSSVGWCLVLVYSWAHRGNKFYPLMAMALLDASIARRWGRLQAQ